MFNPLNWLKALWVKIIDWWKYSRIIFINTAMATAAVIPDLLGYLAGFEWDAFFQHEIAIVLGTIVNIINIYLRINTFGPVGVDLDLPAIPPIPDEPKVG